MNNISLVGGAERPGQLCDDVGGQRGGKSARPQHEICKGFSIGPLEREVVQVCVLPVLERADDGRVVHPGAGNPAGESTLLSFLLFHPAYAEALMELGWADAEARADELAAFFSDDGG